MTKAHLLKTVRKFCLNCCGGSRKEVSDCSVEDCELWPYRFGNARPEEVEDDK